MLSCLTVLLASSFTVSIAQETKLTFAVLTDVHIGYDKAEEALSNSIADINKRTDIQFVLVPGDLTASGSDEQLLKAKRMLDGLNKKYYTIAGNHENAWSESGGTSFKRIFGADKFAVQQGGYLFVGIDCGPILRHGTAHIPSEHIKWMDSLLKKNPGQPVIFVNHYPLIEEVDNTPEVLQLLRKYNTQLAICGHWHTNKQFNFAGIPGALCRSNLPERGMKNGYTIAHINKGEITFRERVPMLDSLSAPWMKVKLRHPSPKWSYQHDGDIGASFSTDQDLIYTGTVEGMLIAIRKVDGQKAWSYNAGGRIISKPALAGNKVLFSSTNGYLYCISTNGEFLWKYASSKAIVSSPAVKNDRVYTGFSDGSFRCFDLKSGKMIWDFPNIKDGFVQATPTFGKEQLYFGAWNSRLYSLDIAKGNLKWEWSNNKPFAYAPASLPPVLVGDRLFILTPDNLITCFDALSGKIIWQDKIKDLPVWSSRGLSKDGKMLYLKSYNGKVFAISTESDHLEKVWEADLDLKQESSACVIIDDQETVFVPSEKGEVYGIDKENGKTLWCQKIGTSPILHLELTGTSSLIVSDQKGQVVCFDF